MAAVRTVLGDIDPGLLGFAHAHEHLFVFPTEGVELAPKLILDDYEKTRAGLTAFRNMGGAAVVDLQPFGAGRHPELLARVSEETGVRVVTATGLHRSFYYPKGFWIYQAGAGELAALFTSEILEGMYDYDPADPFARRSKACAGVIKVGTDADGLTPHYSKVFAAAARAHQATGAPVVTHVELSTWGREQVQFLIERGGWRPVA